MISVGLVVGSPTVASPLPSITTDTHADKFRTEKRGERKRRGYCDKGYDSLPPLFRSGTNKTIGGVKEERERGAIWRQSGFCFLRLCVWARCDCSSLYPTFSSTYVGEGERALDSPFSFLQRVFRFASYLREGFSF